MAPLICWSVLWCDPKGKGFYYRSPPVDRPRSPVPEVRRYKPEDVQKHQQMVLKHLPEARYICLSNVEIEGVETIPLTSGMVGWWPKVELFRPDLPQGRCFYLDLDTLVIRDPRPIVEYPAKFATIKPGPGVGSAGIDRANDVEPWPKWKDQEGFWRVPRYQTSVMVWDSEYGHKFWHAFKPEHIERLASDQDFLGEVFPDEARMPTDWFRKIPKNGSRPIPPRMVVLSMPMRNDEAARKYPWAAAIWN